MLGRLISCSFRDTQLSLFVITVQETIRDVKGLLFSICIIIYNHLQRLYGTLRDRLKCYVGSYLRSHSLFDEPNCPDKPYRSPERQRWIDRFEEIGYLDRPGVGEPR